MIERRTSDVWGPDPGGRGPEPSGGRPGDVVLRRMTIEDRPPRPRTRPAPRPVPRWVAALLPAVLLAAALTGGAIVLSRPEGLFAYAFGALVLGGLGWILVSVLNPAAPDRRCPACGEDALRRLDPDSTRGIGCRACGWQDESASAFVLAEDEVADLDRLVLEEREEARRRRF